MSVTRLVLMSECLTRVCKSIFDLYNIIASSRRYCLFTMRYEFCRLSVSIINVNPNRCCFEFQYSDNMSAPKLESITIDASNCDFEIIHGLILGCLRSFDIEDKIAGGIAHMIRNPVKLRDGAVYTENYENDYKRKVAMDLLSGNCQSVGYSLSFKRNGTWVINKEVWSGSGIDPDKEPLSYIHID